MTRFHRILAALAALLLLPAPAARATWVTSASSNTNVETRWVLIASGNASVDTRDQVSLTLASSQNPSVYGAAVTFTATVTGTGGTPTGTVQFQANGANFGTPATLASGSGGISNSASLKLPVGAGVAVTAVYAGDASFAPCTGTLTSGQTVTASPLTVTASADSKTYGATKTYGTGQSAFTSSGLQNSESIGTVTITASGGTAATDAVNNYTLTPSLAVGGTFAAGNYAISYNTGTLTVSKATPTVTTWPTASAITTVGRALSTSTLSGGSASVTGSFTFTAPAATPPAGNYAAALSFTPSDTANYNTVAGSLNVVVGLAAADDTSPATLLQGGIVANPGGPGKILTFAAIPNFVYQVEAGGNLTDWTPLGTITAGADGRLVITDPAATDTARFYRFKK